MSAIVSKLGDFGNSMATKARGVLDSILPPEKRAELIARAKAFILKNPKISAFLLTNVALTGGPLLLFIFFSISIFVFALLVALIIALLATVAFTLFAVGVALLLLFPTIFFTTLTATFLFLWGLGGYFIFKKFNQQSGPGEKGDTIGDKLNALTGNRLNFVMENAREGRVERLLGSSQDDWKEPSSHGATGSTPKKQNHETNGDKKHESPSSKKHDSPTQAVTSGADTAKKSLHTDTAANGVSHATKASGAGDVGEKAKGAPRKLAQGPAQLKGTATGTIGGATGLT